MSAETLHEDRGDDQPSPSAGRAGGKDLPAATVARLPVYLRALDHLGATTTVSSGVLAEAAGVSPAQLRKDLSHLGSYGTPGVGYDVDHLRVRLGREVGSASEWPVVLVGVGNLGRALAGYSGFHSRGFRVVGLVDPSPALVGTRIRDLVITDLADLEPLVARTGAVIGVVATPADAAQSVADRLVAAGVRSILNFAAAVLVVPDDVQVRKVDLGQELAILAYHEQRRTEPARPDPVGPLAPDHVAAPDHAGALAGPLAPDRAGALAHAGSVRTAVLVPGGEAR